jgi:lipopolysaccharide/colanic/teichoic acid biosynthesis glycosyltransferase
VQRPRATPNSVTPRPPHWAPVLTTTRGPDARSERSERAHALGKRIFDVTLASLLLLCALPLFVLVAVAIKLDSRGSVFYRARRVGYGGRNFEMLKFRKMNRHARGLALTTDDDGRFTRIGAVLALTKLDELPQLWNVVRGDMSIIGPRPEDPRFVALHAEDYAHILEVRPGITGISQVAFAEESRILDDLDPVAHYLERILPQKTRLDRMYVTRYSLRQDLEIFMWTLLAVLLRKPVAVHRETGRMNIRRRPSPAPAVSLEQLRVPGAIPVAVGSIPAHAGGGVATLASGMVMAVELRSAAASAIPVE